MYNYFLLVRANGEFNLYRRALSTAVSFAGAVNQLHNLEKEFANDYKKELDKTTLPVEGYIYEIRGLGAAMGDCANLDPSAFAARYCNSKALFAHLKEF
jgi:hypothetical protein